KNLGYCAIVYLGGLQSLPQDVMHAAQLDGAGAVRRFFSISIPLLSPTTFFLLITTTLNSLQAFDLLRIMTPTGRGTNTMIFESYLQAFGGYSRAGYSATISVLLFIILIVMTVAQILFVERKVHYSCAPPPSRGPTAPSPRPPARRAARTGPSAGPTCCRPWPADTCR